MDGLQKGQVRTMTKAPTEIVSPETEPEFKTYTAREVSQLTGFPLAVIYQEIKGERLRSMRPHGTLRGARMTPDAVRDWFKTMEESHV